MCPHRHFSSAAALVAVASIAWLSGACASIPVDRREEIRDSLDAKADRALGAFIAAKPELQDALDASAGYFVSDLSGAMVAAVGRESGRGVLFDKVAGTRTYMDVRRLALGVGVGVVGVRVLVLIETPEALERFRAGVSKTAASTGTVVGDAMVRFDPPREELSVFMLAKAGAALQTSLKQTRIAVNTELTDVGVSDTGLPSVGFTVSGRQDEDGPRVWNRKLPFLAQKVIDEGYDLPLPYGVGVTWTSIEQDQLLTDLQVAFNGMGEKQPFEFVAFENAISDTDSWQLKLDAWLLPFLNLFAILGNAQGTAPMDVFLDGNGMLEQIGTDCSRPIQPPLCRLLEDRTFILPIRPNVDVDNLGVGMILAGGWRGWFVTVPFNLTYISPEGSVADGESITVTPRFGRVVKLGRRGTLAFFAGGNYLDSRFTIDGSFTQLGEDLTIDYRIEQENTDRWNLVLGLNWEMSSRWSLATEYNGFEGSREALIASFSYRF